jgi:hypothetical protein
VRLYIKLKRKNQIHQMIVKIMTKGKKDDNVVDADFEEVKEENKEEDKEKSA